MSIRLEIRDGRMGRDPELVTDEGGELLEVRDVDEPVNEGDRLTLASGEEVMVIGGRETVGADGWTIVAIVGNTWGSQA